MAIEKQIFTFDPRTIPDLWRRSKDHDHYLCLLQGISKLTNKIHQSKSVYFHTSI